MQTLIITTPRLTLSLPEYDDAPALAAAYTEIADNAFWQLALLADATGAHELIEIWRKGHELGLERCFIVRQESDIVGMVLLQPADGEDGHYNISYWIKQSASGKGFATEAANALSRYAFGNLKARGVSIAYENGNLASRRVIAKLGFVRYAQEIKRDGSIVEIFRRTDVRRLPPLV